jgi:hypothetical protein
MANRLKMAKVNSVLRLHAQGWSYRRIAAELGIHRETVARYVTGFSDDNVPQYSCGNLWPPSTRKLVGCPTTGDKTSKTQPSNVHGQKRMVKKLPGKARICPWNARRAQRRSTGLPIA